MTDTFAVPVEWTGSAPDGSKLAISGSLDVTYTPVPAPTPSSSGVIFGFNADINGGLMSVGDQLGDIVLPGGKFFNESFPLSFSQALVQSAGTDTLPEGCTHPMVSLKPALPMSAADKATLAAIAKEAAQVAPETVLSLWQEGERYWPADTLKAAHAEAYEIVHAAGIRYGQFLTTYSASGHFKFGTLSDFVGLQSNGEPLDIYGFDTYPNDPTSLPAAVLDLALAQLQSVAGKGAVIGITECNYTTDLTGGETYSGSQATWITDAYDWAKANGAKTFLCYFDTSRGVPWPGESGTTAALEAIAKDCGL